MIRVRAAALAAALACSSAMAAAEAAPSYQLMDLGFAVSNITLRWATSPRQPTPGGCESLGGSGPSYWTAGTPVGDVTVGWAPTADGTVHAVWCGGNGYEKDLGVLDGGPNSYAENVSEFKLYIVGWSQTDVEPVPQDAGGIVRHAFISTGSGMTTLLSAMADPHYSSQANAVNDAGEAVGWGEMYFINGPEAGHVGNRAMVWEPDGQVYNLQYYLQGNPAVKLTNATMIDCRGNIAAYGHPTGDDAPTDEHEYLLIRLNPTGQCPDSGAVP